MRVPGACGSPVGQGEGPQAVLAAEVRQEEELEGGVLGAGRGVSRGSRC